MTTNSVSIREIQTPFFAPPPWPHASAVLRAAPAGCGGQGGRAKKALGFPIYQVKQVVFKGEPFTVQTLLRWRDPVLRTPAASS